MKLKDKSLQTHFSIFLKAYQSLQHLVDLLSEFIFIVECCSSIIHQVIPESEQLREVNLCLRVMQIMMVSGCINKQPGESVLNYIEGIFTVKINIQHSLSDYERSMQPSTQFKTISNL